MEKINTKNLNIGGKHFFSKKFNKGFTVMELMVVVTIMMLILSALLLNLNAGRAARNLTIAQNQLVSNIRKVQSYTLSGRNISPGLTADYYVIKFDVSTPTSYKIQAIYDSTVSPKIVDVETINLPSGTAFFGQTVILRPSGLVPASYNADCALLAYKLPFGRILTNNGCHEDSFFPTNDDYIKIVNFVSNTDNYSVSSDSRFVITLINDRQATKTITVYGSTGRIDFQ